MSTGYRHTGIIGDNVRKGLITQHVTGTKHVEHVRHTHQDMAPVIEHVKDMSQLVNEAPTVGNKGDWRYLGSIPIVMLTDWLQQRGVTFDQYARNEGGIRDKFKKWLMGNRDLSKFVAKTYTP